MKYLNARYRKIQFYRWRQLGSQVVEMQEVGNATNPLRLPLARQGALFGMILIIMMRIVTMIMMR